MIGYGKTGLRDSTIRIISITDEDFLNYKKPSMIIAMPNCNFKCCKDAGRDVCHNKQLAGSMKIDIPAENLIKRYEDNPITKAIVFAGLEPLDCLPYNYTVRPYYPAIDMPENKYTYDIKRFNEFKSSLTDVLSFIYIMRNGIQAVCEPCYDDIVIYTGYTKNECSEFGILEAIRKINKNNRGRIIMKFGRYVPDQAKHFDYVLGVKLASDNQFAEVII